MMPRDLSMRGFRCFVALCAVPLAIPLAAQSSKLPSLTSFKLPEWVMKERSWPLDLRVATLSLSTERHEENGSGGVNAAEHFTLSGYEVSLFGKTRGPGIGARTLSGTSPSVGAFKQEEAFVDLGGRGFAVEGAYVRRNVRRTATSTTLDTTATFARGGISSAGQVGATGVRLHMKAGYFVPFKKPANTADALEGWEGETGISYAWNRLPLTAFMGYHYQRFKQLRRAEELSSLSTGIGIWLTNR